MEFESKIVLHCPECRYKETNGYLFANAEELLKRGLTDQNFDANITYCSNCGHNITENYQTVVNQSKYETRLIAWNELPDAYARIDKAYDIIKTIIDRIDKENLKNLNPIHNSNNTFVTKNHKRFHMSHTKGTECKTCQKMFQIENTKYSICPHCGTEQSININNLIEI